MVDRMTVILDAFGGFSSRVPLEELARRTRLPRSTVHRILDSLLRLGWVEHSPGGYHLGPRLHRLGSGEGHHGEIRAAAAPVLNELHHRTGMVVYLGVLEGTDTLCLDRIGVRPDSPTNARVGGRVPAHATAAGKTILASLVPEQVDLVYGSEPLRRCTDRTIADLPALHRDLGRTRARRGVAFARAESSSTSACVGAPVRVDGGTLAAVSLCGTLADTARLERCAPLVLDAGRAVAAALISSVHLLSA